MYEILRRSIQLSSFMRPSECVTNGQTVPQLFQSWGHQYEPIYLSLDTESVSTDH